MPRAATLWIKWALSTFGSLLASGGLALFLKANLLIVGVIWLGVWITTIAWVMRPRRYDAAALEAALDAFYNAMDFPQNADIRCAIWVPDRGAEWLLQITNYMPGNRPGKGRRANARQGIIGRAFRMKQRRVELLRGEEFANSESFQSYMVERWGFTKEEAKRLTQDRRAYLAIPILAADDSVLGVLYCDSNDVSVFEDEKVAERAQQLVPFFRQLLMLRGG